MAQKKNESLLNYLSEQGPVWEVAVAGGASKFVGTMNFYSSDLFSMYRTDGNRWGMSLGATADRKFSKYFSYGGHVAYSRLHGTVTYRGEPTQAIEYMLEMPYGTLGEYQTQVFSVMPTVSFELLDFYYRLMSFKAMSLSRLKLTVGVGLSKTIIGKPAFEATESFSQYFAEYYYDFETNNDTEYTGLLALRYQRIYNERIALYCALNYYFVNGSRLDGYFLGNEEHFEGIPSKRTEGQPQTADTYLNLQLGLIVRFPSG